MLVGNVDDRDGQVQGKRKSAITARGYSSCATMAVPRVCGVNQVRVLTCVQRLRSTDDRRYWRADLGMYRVNERRVCNKDGTRKQGCSEVSRSHVCFVDGTAVLDQGTKVRPGAGQDVDLGKAASRKSDASKHR